MQSSLPDLPHGLRQAVAAMEAKTPYRWSDVPEIIRKFSIIRWELDALAGETYSPWSIPHTPEQALAFWKIHFQFWQKMLPDINRTKALAMCVKGLQEERKHV